MQACAERLALAPDEAAKMGLAKQVGDECCHVDIQRRWIGTFGVDPTPVIDARSLEQLYVHSRSLDWADFLTDLYLVHRSPGLPGGGADRAAG